MSSMKVDYVGHLGTDATVSNAARVSFNKHKDEFDEDDAKLISYLARHNHWTPFSHPTITLRIKAPIFVARQLFKHKVGMTENEVSRRYVDDEPEFYVPKEWRGRPVQGAKQGSHGVIVSEWMDPDYADLLDHCLELYNLMIEHQVAPEQARMVLPQSMMTEWYWTGSLSAYARICKLRLDPHAQSETREVATMISDIISPLFPVSWKALM